MPYTVQDAAPSIRILITNTGFRFWRWLIRFVSGEPLLDDLGDLDLKGIDWMIIGGESGGKVRPFDVTWAAGLIDRCKLQRVKVFVKQLGRKPVCDGRELVVLNAEGKPDRKGTTPAYWPKRFKPLAIRQFPTLA
jgi:protein gp37